MKTFKILIFVFLPVFIFLGKAGMAQSANDTIITKHNESIICKITKITDTDIEYKKENIADAIVYEISKAKLKEIRLGNGKVEIIKRNEMDMNPEAEIIDKRSAIKFNFFSPFFDHLGFTYEKSVRMGLNLETSFGLINNSMFNFSAGNKSDLVQGATIVFGPKFILGNSFYMKGMKFSHPLKGSYFKPEIILTSFAVRNLNYQIYTNNYPYQVNYNTDLRINCASILLNYGNQFILGNTFTFGFNFGIGYSFMSSRYTNPALNDILSDNSNYYYYDEFGQYSSYLFNQIRFGRNFPMVIASSITIGYIFK